MSVRGIIDITAAGAALGTLAQWLPTIAAGLSVVWFLIRIAEYLRVVWLRRPPRRLE